MRFEFIEGQHPHGDRNQVGEELGIFSAFGKRDRSGRAGGIHFSVKSRIRSGPVANFVRSRPSGAVVPRPVAEIYHLG